MFEKIGRKLVQGAKAEMKAVSVASPENLSKLVDALITIGVFALVIFGGRGGSQRTGKG